VRLSTGFYIGPSVRRLKDMAFVPWDYREWHQPTSS
jgi:hypothetical protein